MKKVVFALALVVGLASSSGCGSSTASDGGGSDGSFLASLQGSWLHCFVESPTTSFKDVITFSGSSYVTVGTFHANGSCAGTGTPDSTISGTIAVGAAVTANLGATPVTAYQINATTGGVTYYDLGYISTATTPNRLYLGDSSGANDGSTPALRPTALDNSTYATRM